MKSNSSTARVHMPENWPELDSSAIFDLLPHRPPFLFVDRAQVELNNGGCRTWHLFHIDEPYFAGHFPGNPIVPGVVLLECMAQAGRLILNSKSNKRGSGFLIGVEGAKFNRTVRPGDLLQIEAQLICDNDNSFISTDKGEIYIFKCSAYINSTRCARASIKLYQAHAE